MLNVVILFFLILTIKPELMKPKQNKKIASNNVISIDLGYPVNFIMLLNHKMTNGAILS